MTEGFVGIDRGRLIALRRRVGEAIEFFDGISSPEPCAADALVTVRGVSHRLATEWMPCLDTLVGDRSMLDWSDTVLDGLADHFDALDADDDGELTWEELGDGAESGDADVAAACRFLFGHPLAFVNTALAAANYSIGDVDHLSIDNLDDGGWEFDMDGELTLWQSMTLTPAAIAIAREQNRHQRTLARPAVFAAADAAADGNVDGRVSRGDLAALMEQSDDPSVVAMCRYFLDQPDAFERIDRESPDTGFDGTITYDQLYALGLNQGSLAGLPDPTIPDQLRGLYGDPVDHRDGDTQFLHVPFDPQPGRGQVVIALYIPTPTAGVTVVEDVPVLGDLLVGAGNGRGPDPTAHPSNSQLHVVIDYERGLTTVRIPPSVGLDGGVTDALPIVTGTGAGGMWLGRLTPAGDSNHIEISADESGIVSLDVALLDAGHRAVAPWVDGRYVVSPAEGDQVRLTWLRDPFPAMEAYHIYPDGEIVALADDDADSGAVIGLLSDVGDSGGLAVG